MAVRDIGKNLTIFLIICFILLVIEGIIAPNEQSVFGYVLIAVVAMIFTERERIWEGLLKFVKEIYVSMNEREEKEVKLRKKKVRRRAHKHLRYLDLRGWEEAKIKVLREELEKR